MNEETLREDRRLLGRLLGDVVREQAGDATFDTVERIRQSAVGFHRAEADRAGLESQLNALDIEQTLHVVRAFSYFSLLVNIAEDAHALQRIAEAGVGREALAQQVRLALGHYLNELHELGRELSVSTRIRAAPEEIAAAAAASGDDSPYRTDEPYRRIVAGMYARLRATARGLCGLEAVPAPSVARPAYAGPAEFDADLALVEE